MTPWSKVAQLDASHFDDDTVYAAVNRLRLDDLKPHIYRTHDGGATWKEIVRGLPDGPVNAVREDPVRKGLLFAGTELAVFVSFNDGDDWQPLRLNMPATSIRDLVVHEDDLVVGTHGRGFWILDDIAPLRQLTEADATRISSRRSPAIPLSAQHQHRYAAAARRARRTEPARWRDPLLLPEVRRLRPRRDRHPRLHRQSALPASRAPTRPQPPDPLLNVPTYWIRPFARPATTAGMHRFVWDLHAAPAAGERRRGGEYPISAIYQDTPGTQGEWMPPGTYTVRLTVDGRSLHPALDREARSEKVRNVAPPQSLHKPRVPYCRDMIRFAARRILLAALFVLAGNAAPQTKEKPLVMNHATGKFTVKMLTPQTAGESPFARLLLEKEFEGPLEGKSRVEMLASNAGDKSSGGVSNFPYNRCANNGEEHPS